MRRRRPRRSGALYRRLPPGLHGLEREQVEHHQRARIQGAMISAVAREGYVKTTIARVVQLASVSRTTFYQHFGSRQDCFLQTHDLIVQFATDRVSEAYLAPGDWRERLRAAFVAFMETVASNPEAAKLVVVEALAAGPEALEHRERATETFEETIRQSLDQAPEPAPVSDVTIRAIVGGIRRVVYSHLREGTPEHLPELVDDLFEWALGYRAQGVEPPPDPPRTEAGDRSRQDGQPPGDGAPQAGHGAPEAAEPPQAAGTPQTAGPPPTATDAWRERLTLGHRQRILRAVARIVYEEGYRALTIPEISATAGISNQTFYEHFPGKEQAFLATFDDAAQRALGEGTAAFGSAAAWEEGIRRGLDAVLAFIASEPTFARLAFLHILTAGKAAQERSELVLDGFAAFLAPGFERRPEAPRVTANAITGGVCNVIHHEVAHDRIAAVPDLMPHTTYIALAPFVGARRAAEVALEPAGQRS